MNITIKNLNVIQEAIEARLNAMEPAFEEAVESEKDRLITRTQSGLDINSKQFKGYSKKSGWRRIRINNNKPVNKVDLTFSGDMFDSLSINFRRDGFKFLATLFFKDLKQGQKAKGHQTGQLGRTKFFARPFFGFSNSQRETIASKLRKVK